MMIRGTAQEPLASLVYTKDLDPAFWLKQHRLGEVPGRFPYGLDRLSEAGFRVEAETVRRAGRNPREWIGLADPRLWLPRQAKSGAGVVLAWDEATAVPLLIRHARSDKRLMAGIIWATDAAASTSISARLGLLRQVYRHLDAVWVLSRGQLPVLREWLDVPASRLYYVPLGIDTAYFPKTRLPDSPMVLSMGNDRDRDPATLFEAMRILRYQMPETRVVVQSRAASAAPYGIEVTPRLTGPEVKRLYAQSSVVAIATRHNLHVSGMTTALEAMSMGRPVVLSATPGASDYVQDGTTGRLVLPGDPQAMADAVVELLMDRELLAGMGAAAAAHVREFHTESAMAKILAAIAQP